MIAPVIYTISTLHTIQGTALGTMVGLLTYGNKKYESLDSLMRATIGPLYEATQKMLPLIDRDTEAFNDYMVHVCELLVVHMLSTV